MKILAFDPSGNWREGEGTTGWAWFTDGKLTAFENIKSVDYGCPESYWDDHAQLIRDLQPDVVVYETYKLQAGKAMQQSWSELETPQLIGIIRHECWIHDIPRYGQIIRHECWIHDIPRYGQDPMIKKRFNDDILIQLGIAERRGKLLYINGERTNDHMRDAIRHGLYFIKYGKVV